jgi:hypothetical protein
MDVCVYYDEQKLFIIDITPRELDGEVRSSLEELWSQPVTRKILLAISQGFTRLPDIQRSVGHSASTMHEALERLERAGFVSVRMSYEGNKHKVVSSNVVCVTKNPRHKTVLQKFFQGLWVDSTKTKKIINQLKSDKHRWWSAEELSIRTKIPVDEIELLLSNFDSQTTRSLSQFLKTPPFEKKTTYKYRKL